jgi:hypothetical protein
MAVNKHNVQQVKDITFEANTEEVSTGSLLLAINRNKGTLSIEMQASTTKGM